MKKTLSNLFYWGSIMCVGLVLGVTIKLTSAWVEPDQMPPGGNIAAPINTSNIGQSKIGGMIIALGDVINGLIVKNGKSGFGLDTPTERVDVNGNIKLNGKIIGLQAPTDANDAVNKGYVDALGSGGGGSYETVWGTTECAPGDIKIYDGFVTTGMVHISGIEVLGGGSSFCKKGEKLRLTNPQQIAGGLGKFMAIWSNGYDYTKLEGGYTNSEAIECALCKVK